MKAPTTPAAGRRLAASEVQNAVQLVELAKGIAVQEGADDVAGLLDSAVFRLHHAAMLLNAAAMVDKL